VPFTGDTPVAVAMKHIGEKAESICLIANDVPKCVEEVTFKAMAKETRNRYQSVEELSDDLYALLKTPDITPKPEFNHNDDNDATKKIAPVREVVIDIKDDGSAHIKEENDEPLKDTPREVSRKVIKTDKEDDSGDKKAIFFAMITSILIVGILTVAFGFMFFGSTSSKNLKVPDVVGLTLEKAREIAEGLDAEIEILEYQKSDKEDGIILEQSPKAEVTVASLDRIKVVISGSEKGELIKIDDYTEREFSVVESEIKKLGLKVKKVEEDSDETEVDFVIRQTPDAGDELEKGSTVTLYVSTGAAEEISVPSLVGLTEEEARKALSDAKLEIGSVTRKESNKKEGIVISQSESGMVKEGMAISFVVSKGQQTQNPSNQTSGANNDSPTSTTGNTQAKTKTLTIDLSSYTTPVEIKIVSGGKTVTTTTVDPTKNSEYSASLTGTGTKTFEVHINGVKAVTKTVTFE